MPVWSGLGAEVGPLYYHAPNVRQPPDDPDRTGAEGIVLAAETTLNGQPVLVLGPGEAKHAGLAEGERVVGILLEKMPAGDAARLAARITGLARNALYRCALERTAGGSK